ncbi:hypothetical protein PHMEG_00023651 [Phytophthora megakarya]|uniref:Uncharacterized protein n=1 Tax=Phytophthora megakarya TaxID=4795 RepID=A0A225VGI2_9STRA|nr:hypothetical protein PHMEG_00023651 [Phytophthora megakarya]
METDARNRGRGRTGTETEGSGGGRSRPSLRGEEATEPSQFSLAGTAAGRGAARREIVHDLWTNEEEEKEDDKTVEIKEEKVAVKVEVPDTDVQSLKLDPPGIERFSKEEVSWRNAGDGTNFGKAVKEEPARTPSGFIPWYSGSESRQQSVGGVASSKVVSGSSADKTDAYRSLYGVGGGKSMGPASGNQSELSSNSLSNLPPIALSNTVAHVVKSLPQFFSDSATVEKTTKRERGESIEEWGDRVSELCDSLDYPDARMRYQLFRRGLRVKRCLATLDSSPACDIPEATEWLMFKDMHRPIEEDDEFVGEAKTPNAVVSNQAAIDALSLKMDAILQAQSRQQTQNGFYQPRSPRNRSPRVDAVVNSGVPASGNGFVGNNVIFLDARGKRAGTSA